MSRSPLHSGSGGLRAGDRDREAIAELLRAEHLAGRLDSDELEQRLERCLAATTYAELDAITADLPRRRRAVRAASRPRPHRPGPPGPPATMRGVHVRRVLRGLAGLVAVLVLAIWALASSGSPFWPPWVWLGLAIPFALDAAIRWAWRRPAGAARQAALVWGVGAVIEATLVVIWALVWIIAGRAAYFWPAWSLLGILAVWGVHWILVLRPRLDRASANAELAAQVEELSRSRGQAADAQAAELGRIERDLHDGAQARLVALSMQLGRAELALEHEPGARRLVEDARQEASRAIADLRDLSRGIAPPLLADRRLAAAVRALGARYDAEVEVDPSLEPRQLTPALERGAYFVIAEALTNAAKHASAQRIAIRLALAPPGLCVTVLDDGCGGADPGGSGLGGLRGRVEALGGTLTVTSPAGEGTSLEARFPIGS